jgi:hypothetical protein
MATDEGFDDAVEAFPHCEGIQAGQPDNAF